MITLGATAQNFQRSLYFKNNDFNHFSIETQEGAGYLIGGTVFDGNGNSDMEIMLMDGSVGTPIWSQTIDLANDERLLDVAIDEVNNYAVITGYIDKNGQPELYVAQLDLSTGVLQADITLTSYPYSAGTNIIYSEQSDSYIVGGFYAGNFSNGLTANKAIVLELNTSLVLQFDREITGTSTINSSINDIVEIDGAYFVTGSVSQGVLAMTMNAANLTTVSNLSFQSGGSNQIGVSAVYDPDIDGLWLMSNNAGSHHPQITEFRDISTSAPTLGYEFYLDFNSSVNAAGFQLMQSTSNPGHIYAAGHTRLPLNGTNTWVTEFTVDGGIVNTALYDVPASSFPAQGGGLFSTFAGQQPYIYNQEIIAPKFDGYGIAYLAPREFDSKTMCIDLIASNPNILAFDCILDYAYEGKTIGQTAITATNSVAACTLAVFGGNSQDSDIQIEEFCNAHEPFSKTRNAHHESEIATEVYPNPSNDQFQLTVTDAQMKRFIVHNTLGEVISMTNVQLEEGAQGNFVINLTDQPDGIYFVTLLGDETQRTMKIVKQ